MIDMLSAYLTEYSGFLFYFLSHLGIGIILTKLRKNGRELEINHLIIVIFINYGIVAYLFSKSIFWNLMNKGTFHLFTPNMNVLLLILGVSLLLQCLAVLRTRDLFSRMLLPALLSAMICIGVMIPIGFGIINIVWFCIFVGYQCGLFFFSTIFDGLESILANLSSCHGDIDIKNIMDMAREEMNRLLKIGIQIFLALGASIGVSMTILFQGGLASWSNTTFLTHAFSIIVSFAWIGLGLIFWLVKPYINNFSKVRYYYSILLGENHLIRINAVSDILKHGRVRMGR